MKNIPLKIKNNISKMISQEQKTLSNAALKALVEKDNLFFASLQNYSYKSELESATFAFDGKDELFFFFNDLNGSLVITITKQIGVNLPLSAQAIVKNIIAESDSFPLLSYEQLMVVNSAVVFIKYFTVSGNYSVEESKKYLVALAKVFYIDSPIYKTLKEKINQYYQVLEN